MTRSHKHVDAHPENPCILDSGGRYEACLCGAVRILDSGGRYEACLCGAVDGRWNAEDDKDGWHICDLCK